MCIVWTHEICKFLNYSITKYIKFQLVNKHTFDKCQIKLGFVETMSEIVLYIIQELFLKKWKF